MIYITNKEGLIGDFLGTVPAMQALAKTNKLVVQVTKGAKQLIPIIDNPNEIVFTDVLTGTCLHTLDCQPAFSRATANDWYMSQAFFEQVGLAVPLVAPKANLLIMHEPVRTFDYILSPFARSLPDSQKWAREGWQELVNNMPDKSFCLIGTSKHDDPQFIQGDNVVVRFDESFTTVSNLMLAATKGLISVVTGTSHLAFHLGVKNWILNNQDFKWGTNPDGYSLKAPIPQLDAIKLKEYLEDNP